jgi:hypothetical protein
MPGLKAFFVFVNIAVFVPKLTKQFNARLY